MQRGQRRVARQVLCEHLGAVVAHLVLAERELAQRRVDGQHGGQVGDALFLQRGRAQIVEIEPREEAILAQCGRKLDRTLVVTKREEGWEERIKRAK